MSFPLGLVAVLVQECGARFEAVEYDAQDSFADPSTYKRTVCQRPQADLAHSPYLNGRSWPLADRPLWGRSTAEADVRSAYSFSVCFRPIADIYTRYRLPDPAAGGLTAASWRA